MSSLLSRARNRESRAYWVSLLIKMTKPPLTALANDRLKSVMPVEAKTSQIAADRLAYTHLEAFARLLSGLSPWLETTADHPEEEREREQMEVLARRALANAVDPGARDFMNFCDGDQPLVDAAHLAIALMRGPSLWFNAEPDTRRHIIAALKSTRAIKPGYYNWLLYSALIETFLMIVGERYDRMRIDYALRQHDLWYKGDGIYGDGPEFRWDYYNSFSIHPFLRAVLAAVAIRHAEYADMQSRFEKIAQRYACVLERLIAMDGSFPALGRSIVYRCGAFHHLANEARLGRLPSELPPAQVRTALSAVIDRTLGDASFDAEGWLTIGLCSRQPQLAEEYISTGSLYMASLAFLPLGLPAHDPFWSDDAVAFSAQRLWGEGGGNMHPDHALKFHGALREEGYWADRPVADLRAIPRDDWKRKF